jgi:Ni/Fe-hydrogenase 1 B-type cytochrome subunit
MATRPLTWRERRAAAKPARRSAYVFEAPVRIVHWTVVVCLIVLSLTGFYLEHPFQTGGSIPGHPGFTLATVRFIHEATAFVFIGAVLFRIYWAFVGNRYTHWRGLLPVTKAQRSDLKETLRFYAFRRPRPVKLNGHNPLAGLAYVTLYVLFLITILTGLGLYAWLLRRPPWTTLFGWTYGVLSVPDLRLVHFLLMFFYIAFAVHHVYSAVLFDLEEHNGEVSSIFSGWKANLLEDEAPRDEPSDAP